MRPDAVQPAASAGRPSITAMVRRQASSASAKRPTSVIAWIQRDRSSMSRSATPWPHRASSSSNSDAAVGEVIELRGRDGPHQHGGLADLRRRHQFEGQHGALGREQVGGAQRRLGPGRGEPDQRCLELGVAADRRALAPSGLEEAVEEADHPHALGVGGRHRTGHPQGRRPGLPGEDVVVGAAGLFRPALRPLPQLGCDELENVLVVGEARHQFRQCRLVLGRPESVHGGEPIPRIGS